MNISDECQEALTVRRFKRELYRGVFANDSKLLLEAWYGSQDHGYPKGSLLKAAHRVPEIKAAIHEALSDQEECP